MGQKVHPLGFRLGIIKKWDSEWFATKAEYAKLLHEDIKIRKYIREKLKQAGIDKIAIERFSNKIKITIYSGRTGVIIGKKGIEIENLKKDLMDITNKEIEIKVIEVKKTELSAQLIGENIALQLEKRFPFRRAMKKAITSAMQAGAKGIKVICSGRLAGAEIARSEWYKEGSIPLHTLRADIDYAFVTANTLYGSIGIKVWVFLGEIRKEKQNVITEKNKI